MLSKCIKVLFFSLSIFIVVLLSGVEFPKLGLINNNIDALELTEYKESLKSGKAIKPIPLSIPLDVEKVALGSKLFHDSRLSKNNALSCANCHNLETAGTLNIAKVVGVNGVMGKRNIPTIFNSHYNALHHWDGKFDSLELQVSAPILNPDEMASDWATVVYKLSQDPFYVDTFQAIYGEEISEKVISNAIVAFESSLTTPNSRFDQFLRGDKKALNSKEKEGYQLFRSLGCISCHQGINIGGNTFQKIGLFKKYTPLAKGDNVDLGRYEITGLDADRYVFKVPSLRNVAKTAPYFHDGSVITLELAIALMAEYQLGRELSIQDIEKIAAFLHTLTGKYQGEAL